MIADVNEGYNSMSSAGKSLAQRAKRQFAKDYPGIKVGIDGREGWVTVDGKKAVNMSQASGSPMQLDDVIDKMKQAYLGHNMSKAEPGSRPGEHSLDFGKDIGTYNYQNEGNTMKITKRQLRKIINESMRAPSAEMAAGAAERAATNWYSGEHETLADRKFADNQAFDKDDEDYDMAEFTRGEQDGFNERPYDNPSGNTSYQSGYEDGSHAASMDDDKDEYRGFHEGATVDAMPKSWQQALGGCLDDKK